MYCLRCNHKIKSSTLKCTNCGFSNYFQSGHLAIFFSILIFLFFIVYIKVFGIQFELKSSYERNFVIQDQSSKIRVYSFYTKTDDLVEMEKHARTQLWSLYGKTAILYFNSKEDTPDVSIWGLEFNPKSWKHCVAFYHRGYGHSSELELFKGPIIRLRYVTRQFIK